MAPCLQACRLPRLLFFGGCLLLAVPVAQVSAQGIGGGAERPAEPAPTESAQPTGGSKSAKGTGRSIASQADPYGSLVPVHVMPKVHLEETPPVTGAFLGSDASTDQTPMGFSHSALMFPRSFEPRSMPAPDIAPQVAKPGAVEPDPIPPPAAPQAALPQPEQLRPPASRAIVPQPAVLPAVPRRAIPRSVRPDLPLAAKPRRGSVRPQQAVAVPQPARRPPPARPTARVSASPRIEKVRTGPVRAASGQPRRQPREHYGDLPELVPLPPALQPTAPR